MSAYASTAHSGLPPFYKRRQWRRSALPAIGAAALVGLGLVLFNVFFGSSGLGGGSIPLPPSPPTPKTVQLDAQGARDIHALIRHFVHTAVSRTNLADAYTLIGPGLREDITLKQWTRGQVTVVPYPVDAKTTLVFMKPDWTYAKSVRLQLEVVTPDKPEQMKLAGTDRFFVDLIKMHGRWFVDNWVPRWTPPIPNGN